MSPNRRFTVLIAATLVVGLGALAVLYIPLRKMSRSHTAAEESRWPEAPELELFLQAREAMMPVYGEYGEELEAAIDPLKAGSEVSAPRVEVGTRQMMENMMAALVRRKMSLDRFRELTDLVYLRWWRVTSRGPAPEVELVAHIERYLEERSAKEGSKSVTKAGPGTLRQLEAMRPIARADPGLRLGEIPDEARSLLEAHRERIAAADMGLFDSNYVMQVGTGRQ